MKIAIVNFHYYLFGGPDRYFFNVQAALEEAGHQVVPFSFHSDRNLDTPYSKYFANPVDGHGAPVIKGIRLSTARKLQMAANMFYNRDLFCAFRRLLQEERPDALYTVYLSWTMLPQLLRIAKQEFGLPVVYRLSDFHLVCPSYMFFRDGGPCTECHETPWACLRYRCIHNSRLGSFLRVLQMKWNRACGYYDHVDAFICPTRFMCEWLQRCGISSNRVVEIPTFTKDLLPRSTSGGVTRGMPPQQMTPYILFVGRVVPEKGPEVLVKAFNRVSEKRRELWFVGDVDDRYRTHLEQLVSPDRRERVMFLGAKRGHELEDLLRNADFVVQPALWYENMPNTILEAFSAGRAVIASRLGSLPYLVVEGHNGLLFEPGDAEALAACIDRLAKNESLRKLLNRGARATYESQHTRERHIGQLLALLDALVEADTQRPNASLRFEGGYNKPRTTAH